MKLHTLTIGTTPADGAGLLAGVIEYLISAVCPRTIVLTHFQSVPIAGARVES